MLASCGQGQIFRPTDTPAPTAPSTLTAILTLTTKITPTNTPSVASTRLSANTLRPSSTPIAQAGIGVSREQIQSAYEELEFVFDPPTIKDGQPFVIGGIHLNDSSSVVVILIGPESDLIYTSVSIVEPSTILAFPELGSQYHGKWLFVMQVLLDAVFPDWRDSKDWLDTNLRSFSTVKGSSASAETRRGNNQVILEVLLNDPMPNFLSLVLTIQAAAQAP